MNLYTIVFYLAFISAFFIPKETDYMPSPQQNGISKKTIVIDTEKSRVNIHGKTNINTFKCEYRIESMQSSFDVEVINNPNYRKIKNGSIQLKVEDFICENVQMTNDFRDLLDFKNHPFINVDVQEISRRTDNNFILKTQIQLAGQQQKYQMQMVTDQNQEWVYCEGEQKICITDFGLVPPEKFFGMVRVDEKISIRFQLYLKII